jgi:hypothetical protein
MLKADGSSKRLRSPSAPVASQRVARRSATTGARVGHRAARMRTRARQQPQLDTFVLVRPHTRAHPPSRGVPRACPPARLAVGRFMPRCRFYKAAGVAQVEQDDARTGTLKTVWALTLDGRHVRTPANKVCVCVCALALSLRLPAAGRWARTRAVSRPPVLSSFTSVLSATKSPDLWHGLSIASCSLAPCFEGAPSPTPPLPLTPHTHLQILTCIAA